MKLNFSIIFFFVAFQLSAQTIQQIEKELSFSYRKLKVARESKPIIWDSVELYKKQFEELLLLRTSSHPESFDHPFDSLIKLGFSIIKSENRKLKIYSWNTHLGGTMLDFSNLYQFKSGDSIFNKMLIDSSSIKKVEQPYIPFYSKIYEVKKNKNIYYLVIGNAKYSSVDYGQIIKVLNIENGALSDTCPIFEHEGVQKSTISLQFNLSNIKNNASILNTLIRYNKFTKTIKIPLTVNDNIIKHKYETYKFNGNYFKLTKSIKRKEKRTDIYDF